MADSGGVRLIRVKRKHDDDPMEALVVSSKHQIVSKQGHRRQIFRRVGTVQRSSDLERGASRLTLLAKINEISAAAGRTIPSVKAGLSDQRSVAASRDRTKKTIGDARKLARQAQQQKQRDLDDGDDVDNEDKNDGGDKGDKDAGQESTKFNVFDIVRPGGEQCDQRQFKKAKSRKSDSLGVSRSSLPLRIIPETKPGESISDIMCNFVPMVRSKLSVNEETTQPVPVPVPSGDAESADSSDGFVYDLYYSEDAKKEAVDWLCDGAVDVVGFDDFGGDEYMSDSNDSEDSNAENYWGNEYPDTDQFTSEDSELDSDDEITRMEQADFTEKLGSRWNAYKTKAETFLQTGVDYHDSNGAIIYDDNSEEDMDYY